MLVALIPVIVCVSGPISVATLSVSCAHSSLPYQVLLCEEWAKEMPNCKVVTCHPGWTLTPVGKYIREINEKEEKKK